MLFFSEVPGCIEKEDIKQVFAESLSTEIPIRFKCGRCQCDRPWMVDAETQCNLFDNPLNELRRDDCKTDFKAGKLPLSFVYLFF